MNLSVLIVEDSRLILNHLTLLVNTLSKEQKAEAGIEAIHTDKASNLAEAEALLHSAAQSRKPYDILMLDLSLPQQAKEADNVRGGLNLILKARELQAVRKIIIVSGNFDLESHVSESFKRGAICFIRKPYSEAEVQQQVLNTVGLLSEEYLFKCYKLVDERIPVLSASIWRTTTYEISARVYNLVQTISYETEELGREFNNRFGITDPEDSVQLRLAEIERAIENSREEMADLQNGIDSNGNQAEEVTLENEILALAEALKPCLEINLVSSPTEKSVVLSFHQNVRTVLKEILVGGLSEQTDSTRTWQVTIEISRDEAMASVFIRDDFPPLNPDIAARISKGESIPPEDASNRQWGLFLAQHIALRGGGRLIVETTATGNQITYMVPRA